MKDTFLLFTEHKDAVGALSDEDAGKLLKAMYAFHAGDESAGDSLPPMAKLVFLMLKPVFERSQTKYEETVQKRREAGAKGGRPRKACASSPEAGEANASEAEAGEANGSECESKKSKRFLQSKAKSKLKLSESESDSESVLTPPLPPSPGGGACEAPASAPLSGEEIENARDAVQAERRRGDYEFSLLRSEYDKARQEGPMAGRQEFLQLFASQDFPGLDEILAGLQRLLENDDQFRRGYAPGLSRFLRERMWAMRPRAPAGQEREPERTPEELEAERKIAEMRARRKAREAERRQGKTWTSTFSTAL